MYFLLKIRPAFLASLLKKLFKIKREIIKVESGSFYIDKISNFGSQLKLKGEYEPELKESIKDSLKEGSTFIDLGANEGYFSVIAGKIVGKSGRVISIEPQSRLQETIKKNISLNSLNNVELIQSLISDKREQIEISLSPDTNTGSSGVLRKQKYRVAKEIVSSISLEQLVNDLHIKTVDLIKIDIEGSEYEAILGSKNLFEKHFIKNIALELHPQFLKQRNLNEADILKFLEKCGYKRNHKYKNLYFSIE